MKIGHEMIKFRKKKPAKKHAKNRQKTRKKTSEKRGKFAREDQRAAARI
jgi:hypothetical protein